MIKINLAKPELILGDSLEVLKQFPDEFIDLVVTSPPYDNLRTYNGTNDWNFDKFKEIAKELTRTLKKGGVIVWVVNDATEKGSETLNSFKQAIFFKEECGLSVHDTMIYHKKNPMPYKHNRYLPCFEYMFVFSKDKPKTFNPIMEPSVGTGLYRTHQRGADGVKKKGNGFGKPRKSERLKFNLWTYIVGSGQTTKDAFAFEHPAIFPDKLAEDHILSWSNPGDIVLDPFMGSGTTGKMALKNGRKFIGIERVPEYMEISKKRIEAVCEAI